MNNFEKIVSDIKTERDRQDLKWGSNRVQPDLYWNAILVEEVGEVSKAILENNSAELRKELIQTVAVGVAWLEALETPKTSETYVTKLTTS